MANTRIAILFANALLAVGNGIEEIKKQEINSMKIKRLCSALV